MSDDFEQAVQDSLASGPAPAKKWGGWKETFGDTWSFDLKESPVIVGKLVDFRQGVGQYHSNVYTLVTIKGQKWTVWGATALDWELTGETKGSTLKFPMGCWLRIEYLGMKTNESNHREFKAYDVKSSDVPPPSDE